MPRSARAAASLAGSGGSTSPKMGSRAGRDSTWAMRPAGVGILEPGGHYVLHGGDGIGTS